MSLVTKTWSKFGQFDYLMMKICFLNVSSTSFAFLFGQVISFAPENYFVAIKKKLLCWSKTHLLFFSSLILPSWSDEDWFLPQTPSSSIFLKNKHTLYESGLEEGDISTIR